MTAGEAIAAFRGLPVKDLDALTGGGRAVILAPHPDDESLGCGGFIAESCRRSQPPVVVVLTDGTGSHPNSAAYPPERLARVREEEAAQAVTELGLGRENLVFLRQPDTAAPTSGPAFDRVAEEIAAICVTAGARVLLAPWRHDPHCDHEAAHLLATEAARHCGVVHVAYPVWGWTLTPDLALTGPAPVGQRLDIALHLAAKRRAIAAHRSQRGEVIEDDPGGFVLPAGLLGVFEQPFETFLTEP